MSTDRFDFVVVGSGPGGQKAALCAASEGRRVLVVEREPKVGGACVHQGTIPSKTLRHTALSLRDAERGLGESARTASERRRVDALMTRLGGVLRAHTEVAVAQLARAGIEVWRGHARFVGEREMAVRSVDGRTRRVSGDHVVLAVGSRPRAPENVPVDHETILDSDSILSLTYLPQSMIVLGGGVIASEYASIFACLGVKVTMVDTNERPMAFLDPELTGAFLAELTRAGGRYIGRAKLERVTTDGVSEVEVMLASGEVVRADKALCALGRVANVGSLDLPAAGLATNARGIIPVDEHCRTAMPQVYAVGDVAGPPSLASSAMEQGRRAVRHALGLPNGGRSDLIPFCAYTIPEIASVGLSEAEATAKHGGALVGRAPYRELARAQIAAYGEGMVKLVATPDGKRLLGVQVVGDGASELVTVGQMALVGGLGVEAFVEATFNYPTLAEGYRVAALDALRRVVRSDVGELAAAE